MALYGYARVSILDQSVGNQRAALKAAGCDVIRAEKASGTRRDGRTELQVLLDFLRPGDILVVTRIGRLARSLRDLQNIVHELREKRVTLCATEQPIITGTAAGKAFLDMLGVSVEFETNLRKERQAEGIAAAKARGVYQGESRRLIQWSSTSSGTR
jgi:DNA invertase Pin-like site-specific DNA recombinase